MAVVKFKCVSYSNTGFETQGHHADLTCMLITKMKYLYYTGQQEAIKLELTERKKKQMAEEYQMEFMSSEGKLFRAQN